MKRILVLGAKLQGTEIIYLAKEAGYYVTVIDRNPLAPGADLADEYICEDILNEEAVKAYFRTADAVIPAIEDLEVLERAVQYGSLTGTKVLFDLEAYRISSSKNRSNQLFSELRIPMPRYYPDCAYPVIVKPDGLSGSAGVVRFNKKEQLQAYLREKGSENAVIQEYLQGPSYSLEVIGDGERFYFPQITEVVVDDNYDCKRIIAPARISGDIRRQMLDIGQTLANRLKIKGIFDIEVIEDKGVLKILEIDARFPSQTPISVYRSTGLNMVKIMVELLLDGRFPEQVVRSGEKACIYQQIQVSGADIEVLGEHIISGCSHLKRVRGFLGADEVLTDYFGGSGGFPGADGTATDYCGCKAGLSGADEVLTNYFGGSGGFPGAVLGLTDYPGSKGRRPGEWRAIVIITRDSEEQAFQAFEAFLTNIRRNYLKVEKTGRRQRKGVLYHDKASA
ncbi:MAG: 3-methylornithine--L-lysine ligase PylC [Lachnospiraceae bacterium]|nr:3-methylornithine--L-lysine ligase PylC [Lachnospiraceae bacterium]